MSTTPTTATTATPKPADAIRAALKAKGISRKQVSVRHDHYSMGSTIRVKVLDPSVRLSVVRDIANEHQRVRYCEYSGEILSGGNRFVDVEYAAEALAPLAAELGQELSAVKPDGIAVEVHSGQFHAFITAQQPDYMRILDRHSGREVVYCWCGANGPSFAARQLAQHILDPQER